MENTSTRVEQIERLQERLRTKRIMLLNGSVSKYSTAGLLIQTADLNLALKAWSMLLHEEYLRNMVRESYPDPSRFADESEHFEAVLEWASSSTSRESVLPLPEPVILEIYIENHLRQLPLSEDSDPIDVRRLASAVVSGIQEAIAEVANRDNDSANRALAVCHGMVRGTWAILAPVRLLQQFSLELGRVLSESRLQIIVLLPIDDGTPIDKTYF